MIGSSGTFPSPSRPASGYLIENGSTRIWCDTGPDTFTSLPCDPALIDAVFISHRHPDHCTDLFAAFHAWTYVPEPRTRIPLYANGDVLDHAAAFLGRNRPEVFGETFTVCEVNGGDRVSEGSIEIAFHDVEHSVPALGTTWTGNGRTLFYTGDTGPGVWSKGLSGIDVLLCEAALQGTRTEADFIHHLTAFEAGELARANGVGQLMLTHIPPYMDPTISITEAETAFGKSVSLAVPGVQVQV